MIERDDMSLEEAILEKIRHLPPAKQEEVLRFAGGLEREMTKITTLPIRDRKREMTWIEENRSAYANRWGVRGRRSPDCRRH
jgi:hypothetical protein